MMTVARAFATQKLRARSDDGRARICDAETVRAQWRLSRAHLQRRNCTHAVMTVTRAFATQKLRARSDDGGARICDAEIARPRLRSLPNATAPEIASTPECAIPKVPPPESVRQRTRPLPRALEGAAPESAHACSRERALLSTHAPEGVPENARS